jgi:hypothetical protein
MLTLIGIAVNLVFILLGAFFIQLLWNKILVEKNRALLPIEFMDGLWISLVIWFLIHGKKFAWHGFLAEQFEKKF